jgi:hypothetical protein
MDSSDRTPFHIHECFVGRRCCGCPANDLGFLGDPLARERNEICGLFYRAAPDVGVAAIRQNRRAAAP